MPLYEYQCQVCHGRVEHLQRLSDPPLRACPTCGGETLERIVSKTGFQLKGTGWYATDFKDSGKRGAGKDEEKGKDKPSDEAKTPAKKEGAQKPGAESTAGAVAPKKQEASPAGKASDGEKK